MKDITKEIKWGTNQDPHGLYFICGKYNQKETMPEFIMTMSGLLFNHHKFREKYDIVRAGSTFIVRKIK